MTDYSFTLAVEGADLLECADALYDAGLDDALVAGGSGRDQVVEFDREGESLVEVVLCAIEEIEEVVPGARVTRVEPADLVTLAEIARRVGRTHESVRLLAEGRRGPGDFPRPVSDVDAKTRVWEWSTVARWFGDAELDVDTAEAVAAINGALTARVHARRLSKPLARRVLELARE